MINGRAKLKIWDVVCGRFMRMKNGIIRLLRFSSEDAWLPWFVDTSIFDTVWGWSGSERTHESGASIKDTFELCDFGRDEAI